MAARSTQPRFRKCARSLSATARWVEAALVRRDRAGAPFKMEDGEWVTGAGCPCHLNNGLLYSALRSNSSKELFRLAGGVRQLH